MIKAFKILLFVAFSIFIFGCSSSSQVEPLDENLVFDEESDFEDEVDDLDFSDLDVGDLDEVEEFSLEEGDLDNSFDTAGDDEDVSFDEFDESDSVADTTSDFNEDDDLSFDEFDDVDDSDFEADVSGEFGEGDDLSFDEFDDVEVLTNNDSSEDVSFDDFEITDADTDGFSEFDDLADEAVAFDSPQDTTGEIAFEIKSQKNEKKQKNLGDSNKVKSIDYFTEVSGGAFSIETSKMPRFKTEFVPDTKQFVLTLLDTEISKKLNRPFLTKDFKQSFKSMSSYQDDQGDVRFVFKLSEGVTDQPKVVTEENGVVVRVAEALSVYAQNDKSLFDEDSLAEDGPLGKGESTLDDLLLNKIEFKGRPISIQAKDEEVVNIINFISEDVGANIIVSDTVKGTISLKLNQVPWDQALVVIMKAKGLGYVRNGNVLRIASIDELKKEALAAEEVARANQKFAPFHVKVFPLSYAKPQTVEEKIKPFLTVVQGETGGGGQVISEERSSSLIVRDRSDVIKNIAKLIKELDQPPLQVMIRAKIVEANKNFERELGSRFNIGFNSSQRGSQIGFGGGLNLGDTGDLTGQLNVLGLDFFGNLTQTLRISELESNLRVLSSPSVMAVNNEKAVIVQSDEVLTPQILDQGQSGSVQPVVTFQRDPVELRLEVTPQVSSDGNVIMDLLVKRQVPGEEQSGTRPISTREAQTKVIVGNNKTAMIGGVYQTRETGLKNGVPVLRKIPLIKWLFGREVEEKVDTELVIFITPKVINARGISDPLNAKSKSKVKTDLTAQRSLQRL